MVNQTAEMGQEMYRVSDVAEVVLGQAGGPFRDILQGRKPVNPEFKMYFPRCHVRHPGVHSRWGLRRL